MEVDGNRNKRNGGKVGGGKKVKDGERIGQETYYVHLNLLD